MQMVRQTKTLPYRSKLYIVTFGKFQEKAKIWYKILTKHYSFVQKIF